MDSQVDRETMIMRMGCLNSAIAYFALPAEEGAITQTKDVLRVASDFEVHVTRSID